MLVRPNSAPLRGVKLVPIATHVRRTPTRQKISELFGQLVVWLARLKSVPISTSNNEFPDMPLHLVPDIGINRYIRGRDARLPGDSGTAIGVCRKNDVCQLTFAGVRATPLAEFLQEILDGISRCFGCTGPKIKRFFCAEHVTDRPFHFIRSGVSRKDDQKMNTAFTPYAEFHTRQNHRHALAPVPGLLRHAIELRFQIAVPGNAVVIRQSNEIQAFPSIGITTRRDEFVGNGRQFFQFLFFERLNGVFHIRAELLSLIKRRMHMKITAQPARSRLTVWPVAIGSVAHGFIP